MQTPVPAPVAEKVDLKIPEFKAPEVKLEIPEFKAPDLKMPSFTMPKVDLPDVAKNAAAPTFTAPKFDIPKVEMPKTPSISIPKLDVRTVEEDIEPQEIRDEKARAAREVYKEADEKAKVSTPCDLKNFVAVSERVFPVPVATFRILKLRRHRCVKQRTKRRNLQRTLKMRLARRVLEAKFSVFALSTRDTRSNRLKHVFNCTGNVFLTNMSSNTNRDEEPMTVFYRRTRTEQRNVRACPVLESILGKCKIGTEH